jgi:hypothetical protein
MREATVAKTKTISAVLVIVSVAMFLVSGWFFLWVLSSASLASGECMGDWLTLWNTPGCRNPVYAQFGFIVTLASSVILFVWGIRKPKE